MDLRKRIGNPKQQLSLKQQTPTISVHNGNAHWLKCSVLCLLLFVQGVTKAQNVAINSDGSLPDKNAILDIKSNSKGLLIPRMTTELRMKIPNTQGLIVYDVNTNSFWYNTGRSWQNMVTDAAALAIADSAWLLTGNAGTVDGTHFLGTKDNVPLNFRVNNTPSGKIDHIKFNTFFGYRAGMSISPLPFFGRDNTAYGFEALMTNSSGISNTAIGARALRLNQTGISNTAVGESALGSNTFARGNTAIGNGAMFQNTTGELNTAVGVSALFSNVSGTWNTAVGSSALNLNVSGSYNTAVGHGALLNSTAYDNTATGALALFSNTTGGSNSAFGKNALNSNTTGIQNTAVGSYALNLNILGSGNTATGFNALASNRGSQNTAHGAYALYSNVNGHENTAVGYNALYASANVTGNTAVGVRALRNNSTGNGNTAQGSDALVSNTTGGSNTAVGSGTMFANIDGRENTALGVNALFNLTAGNGNTAIGISSLLKNVGTLNTAVGYWALASNVSGNDNTAIGQRADVSSPGLTNATAIGAGAVVNASNKVRIGNAAVTVIEGQVPFTTPSDGRFKFGVQEDVKGLDFILQLRPVTYLFDVKRFDGQLKGQQNDNPAYDEAMSMRRSGFIAQEVEKAAISSGYNFSGIIKPKTEKEHYSLSYDAFVVPLVKGMQEQQAIIDAQKKKIEEQQQVNDAQNKKLAELERELNEIKKLLKH